MPAKKRRSVKRFCRYWNNRRGYVTLCIRRSKDKNAAFKWNQLVVQEVRMWMNLGKVDQEEFDWICKRRGFDQHMRKFLSNWLVYIGLGRYE